MFQRIQISFIIIILLISSAMAKELSLSDALEAARKYNPELAAAKALWEAAKAKVPQALSLDDPKIGVEYDSIPSGSRNLEDGMKMFTADQMIKFPPKIYAEWKMAGREAELVGARYQAKLLELSSQVRSAYYDLFLADRSIELMRESNRYLVAAKKSAEAKYLAGGAPQVDVIEANIEALSANNDLLTQIEGRTVQEARLKSLLAGQVGSSFETSSELALPDKIQTVDELEKLALINRPSLLAMKAEYEAKDNAQLLSQMNFFPDFDLGARKRVGDGWDAMFSFTVPLYFWKQGYGLSSAGFEREATKADYQNMQNMTRWEIREAYVMANAAKRTISLYEKSILPQSLQAHLLSLAAYRTGKLDFRSLLQMIKMHQEAELKYYESQVNYGKALAKLDEITGGEIK